MAWQCRGTAGFTLIELMIVMVAIAILAAIAMPMYGNYIRESRRADGKAALLDVKLKQEKFRANCVQYATAFGGTSACNTGTSSYVLLGASTSPDGYYNLALASAGSAGFTATATAISADQQKDRANGQSCATLTLTVSGPTETTSPADCWK